MFDTARFAAALHNLWPHGDAKIPGLRDAIVAQAPALFDEFAIKTPMAIANMMGEFTVECGGGWEIEENLNYRATALVKQWPKHFTMAQAMAMEHKPQLIANQAYNGRMGNRVGSNDGWDFRGRGPAQTTGRDAYDRLGKLLGVDLVSQPERINTKDLFLRVGVVDFVVICKCLPYAERDDEINETRCLNGGLIGLADRQKSIAQWKHALGVN
ncbi:glycoside hydrolase family 19 protein [Bradyrhizobium sp. PMVTL-01]|uniref:glycoside hydrolase family 19 protein n=1 Tax=Bradyrhizobium sp. PMVTL-01 TaxID=3434999 RepID=UPI003F72568E